MKKIFLIGFCFLSACGEDVSTPRETPNVGALTVPTLTVTEAELAPYKNNCIDRNLIPTISSMATCLANGNSQNVCDGKFALCHSELQAAWDSILLRAWAFAGVCYGSTALCQGQFFQNISMFIGLDCDTAGIDYCIFW